VEPPAAASTSRLQWWLIGAGIFVLLIAAIIIFGFIHVLTSFNSGSTSRTVASPTSSRLASPSSPARSSVAGPPSTTFAIPSIPSPGNVPGSTQSPEIIINDNGLTKTVACNDQKLLVNGSDNNVTVTGHCTNLNVNGINNRVTVDAADSIQVNGITNTVTYHSGSPHVFNGGMENTVQQG
jgi:hypothetical protein